MRLLRLAVVPWRALAIDRAGCRPLPVGERYDLGIVPGATVYADGSASGALRRRVALAAELWEQGMFPCLLISGLGSGARSEASVGAELAVRAGVPRSLVLEEPLAMSTAENARFSAAMVSSARVLVITDTTHVARCERLFGEHFAYVRGVGTPLGPRSRARMAIREALIEAWTSPE